MSHDAKQERESGTRMENGKDETLQLHQWMVLVFLRKGADSLNEFRLFVSSSFFLAAEYKGLQNRLVKQWDRRSIYYWDIVFNSLSTQGKYLGENVLGLQNNQIED